MIDGIWRILALALLAVVLIILLRKTSPESAFVLAAAVCGVMLFLAVEFADSLVSTFQRTVSAIGISEELFFPLLKIVAIAVLTKTAADICRDAGETSVGNLLETAGGFAAILVSLPLFSAAWELMQELL